MSTIVLRATKGTPLTNTEVDANFSNLNTDKLQLGGTYSAGTANGVLYLNASKVLTTGTALTYDGSKLIVAGTISETVGTTQYLVASQYDVGTAANQIPLNQYLGNMAFQDSAYVAVANLGFVGVGGRIIGDFSNATIANRVMFQTSTANANTNVQAIPNGTAVNSGFLAFNNSDPTNAAFIQIATSAGTESRLTSGITGTGTYLPMTFYTGGQEAYRVSIARNISIGDTGSVDNNKFTVYGNGGGMFAPNADNANNGVGVATLGTSIATATTAMAKLYMTGANNAHAGCLVLRSGSVVTSVAEFYNTSGAVGLTMDANGSVLSKGGQGIGYGTGSGGTVTQATSKSTAVTLNKPTGQITMNNAALAAGAEVQFGVNNTLVTANDVVIVNQSGAAINTTSYQVRVAATANNAFYISVKNLSGISLSEALVINFAIIKGATA